MKLVPNVKDALRWFSVQAMALQVAALSSWLAIPEEFKAAVPQEGMVAGAVLLAVLGIIGRMIDQTPSTKP